MSEVNNQAPVAVTAEQIQEMITTAIAGYATKADKHFNKMHDSFSEQVKALKPAETEGTTTTGNVQADPKVAALERTLADLTKAHKAAEEKAIKAEQKQVLSDALSTFTFASEKARDVAASTLESQMQRSADGKYFIGDRDLKTAVAEEMKQLPGLLAPLNVGSSGATGTQQNVGTNLGTLIKPQMSKDEISQAYAEFGKMLGK